MPSSEIDTLLIQNPDAPTNDDFAREVAKKLFLPRDQRMERVVEFNLAEGVLFHQRGSNCMSGNVRF